MTPARRDTATLKKVALSTAQRLTDPETVRTIAHDAAARSQLEQPMKWHATSLAQGDCGMAVAMAAFDAAFPDDGWDRVGKLYLENAANELWANTFRGPSLFSGTAGVAFAAEMLSRDGSRYRRLLEQLDGLVCTSMAAFSARIRLGERLPVSSFDIISGLSGICAYALSRSDASKDLNVELVTAVDSLAELALDTSKPPQWATPHSYIGRDADSYPFGNLNLGLAHGIPGVLAILGMYGLQHGSSGKVADATARIIEILKSHMIKDQWGIQWPAAVPMVNDLGDKGATHPTRSAWCYGAPGIARAMWLGGTAIKDDGAKEIAASAILDVFARPKWARAIDSPSICHGMAGLLMIAHAFEQDGCHDIFSGHVDILIDELLSEFDEQSTVGFRSIEIGTNRVDQPGLLDGAAGIAITLLSIADPSTARWQRAFCVR